MSDARAVEAVTETLRNLIDAGVKEVEPGAVVVTRPPDQVLNRGHELQVNLFLYQTTVDGSLRNQPPVELRPGETGPPALPLILHYLVTPYVQDGNDLTAHRLFGAALRSLYEHPVLTRTDLIDAAPYSDVGKQIEQVRISWQPLDEKDIFSLWSIFQSPYRTSAAFEVRVVLIDSTDPTRTPLPVLRRGPQDRGPVADAGVRSPFPTLTGVTLPRGEPAALLGERVTLSGFNLSPGSVLVRLANRSLGQTFDVTPDEATARAVTFTVPARPDHVPAGLWSLWLAPTGTSSDGRATNEVPLAIAPRITSALPMTVHRDGFGTAVVHLTCEPSLWPTQRVFLLLGDRAMPATPRSTPTHTAEFLIGDAEPGDHLTRLRVDGVDTRVIDRTRTPPVFDTSQIVTVT